VLYFPFSETTPESIEDPCPDEQYRAFALANFGIEDIEEDDDED
jgi:hypothetical protein